MTTCPFAPRQARGLRGAALRRLSASKCPRIYQTHDMRPTRCDARPLATPWQGEAMTKIDVKATPEWLAQQAVVDGAAEGFGGFVLLVRANGNRIGAVPYDNNPGRLPAIRAWLVEQIEAGYNAGTTEGRAANADEIRQAYRAMVPGAEKALAAAKDNGIILGWQKNKDTSFLVSLGHGTDLDVAAGDVAVVLKAADKVRRREILVADGRVGAARGDALTAHANELRAALGVTDPWDVCIATVRDLVARDKARPAPTDAAAEDAAIDGLVDEAARLDIKNDRGTTLHHRDGDIAIFLEDTRSIYVRAWLRPWLLAAWARGVAYGQQPDAPPVLADSFGMASAEMPGCGRMRAAVREQIAAERAVDAAAVAPSEEALARARAEGAVEAFRKVAEWCQTAVPDGIDLDASIVEEVAKDCIGTLQHAAGAGDEKMREEGRRLGWKEAVDMMSAIVDQKIDDAKLLEQDEERLRKNLAEVVERKADHMVHADALLQALARVRLVAPKEAP